MVYGSNNGVMVLALGPTEIEYEWYFQVPRTSRQRHRADVMEGVLDLLYPAGVVVRWSPVLYLDVTAARHLGYPQ